MNKEEKMYFFIVPVVVVFPCRPHLNQCAWRIRIPKQFLGSGSEPSGLFENKFVYEH